MCTVVHITYYYLLVVVVLVAVVVVVAVVIVTVVVRLYSVYSTLGGFTFWQKCEFYKMHLICSAYNLPIDGNEN